VTAIPAGAIRATASDRPAGTRERLSPTQLRIMEAIARGMSTEEISEATRLPAHTVRTAASNVIRLTGARNRIHAAVLLVQTGIIRIPIEPDRVIHIGILTSRPVP
jgi:DNA-binding NarL/FixJ family response regulator